MAYSNWGSFVYKNDERMKNREDVAVFNEDESDVPTGFRIFANLLKNKEKYGDAEGTKTPWHEHSHHAVLGSGPLRLCGYKCSPELWVLQANGEIEQIPLPSLCGNDGEIRDADTYFYVDEDKYPKENKELLQFQGSYRFSVKHYNGNMIDLELVEPDGTVWKSTCGYCYGAGHTD